MRRREASCDDITCHRNGLRGGSRGADPPGPLAISRGHAAAEPAAQRGAEGRRRGNFSQRLIAGGEEEFASLVADFNRMAEELDGFYHQLEQKVAQKSRELVRSERLASVGFLAAGVAHEINNPLGIISGYAEYMLEQLKTPRPALHPRWAARSWLRSLQVISDEAFRCKDITSKLLSLARQGDESRQPVNLAEVAEQVAAMVGGLPAYRGTKSLRCGYRIRGEELVVSAVEAEMKQVVLNLTLNALEAVDAATWRR